MEENLDSISNLTKPTSKKRSRISIYEINDSLIEFDLLKMSETNFRNKNDIENESKDWSNLLKTKVLELKKLKNETITIDKSVLTSDRQAFIDQVPDFKNFEMQSKEFYIKAQYFLDMQTALDKRKKYLQSTINEIAREKTNDIISKNIYNIDV